MTISNFPVYTVYWSPSDHPGLYVVQLRLPGRATRFVWTAPTLEEARRLIPVGLVPLGRCGVDDACIVETWV